MKRTITVAKGLGTGDTKMAAFDAALLDAGVANYNLIRLSSIIPPGSELRIGKAETREDEFGHKLYVVYASQIENEMGKDAWAGIGWVMAEDGTDKGLFTEHEGHSEQEVQNLINETLSCMTVSRGGGYSAPESVVAGITCTEKPVCALVIAVYAAESWD
ncbi:MAG TPA: pyruvoyl-dependent arginine decarboxylase [Candidatus Paceibacterota bacterium]|jgi:arginine decarboxylase